MLPKVVGVFVVVAVVVGFGTSNIEFENRQNESNDTQTYILIYNLVTKEIFDIPDFEVVGLKVVLALISAVVVEELGFLSVDMGVSGVVPSVTE